MWKYSSEWHRRHARTNNCSAREDLVAVMPCEGEGKIDITSTLGESETIPLRIFGMKIKDYLHRDVLVTYAVSTRLANDLLSIFSAYSMPKEDIELHRSIHYQI